MTGLSEHLARRYFLLPSFLPSSLSFFLSCDLWAAVLGLALACLLWTLWTPRDERGRVSVFLHSYPPPPLFPLFLFFLFSSSYIHLHILMIFILMRRTFERDFERKSERDFEALF